MVYVSVTSTYENTLCLRMGEIYQRVDVLGLGKKDLKAENKDANELKI